MRRVKHLGFHCIGPTITPERIASYQRELRASAWLERTRERMFLLGGRRLDILYLLTRERELCVCDLSDILGTTVSAVSHQLKILRERGLVRPRRESQTIFYALTARARRLVARKETTYADL